MAGQISFIWPIMLLPSRAAHENPSASWPRLHSALCLCHVDPRGQRFLPPNDLRGILDDFPTERRGSGGQSNSIPTTKSYWISPWLTPINCESRHPYGPPVGHPNGGVTPPSYVQRNREG